MPQRDDEADTQTGWKRVYAVVIGSLVLTLLLLGLFSRYFSG